MVYYILYNTSYVTTLWKADSFEQEYEALPKEVLNKDTKLSPRMVHNAQKYWGEIWYMCMNRM